jgi:hypothetical protein
MSLIEYGFTPAALETRFMYHVPGARHFNGKRMLLFDPGTEINPLFPFS